MDTVHNPHDALFREVYSRKAEAQSFLEEYLPQDVLAVLDTDSLDICKDSFVDDDLKAYYADILYSVNFEGQPGYVYILFEHKSYPDRLIHLQMLEYMLKIWRLHLNQHKTGKNRSLPIILPVLLYHGREPWPYERQFIDQFCGPAETLLDSIPDFRILLVDLSRYTDDDIRGTLTSRIILLLFKHIFHPDLRAKLPDIMEFLREVIAQKSGLRMLEIVLRYIYSAAENTLSVDDVVNIVRRTLQAHGGEIPMTIAQQLLQQGREEGRKEAMETEGLIGAIQFAQRMLHLPLHEHDELQRKEPDELRRLLAQLEAAMLDRDQSGQLAGPNE